MKFALFRRREIWLPTFWGWLAVIAIVIAMVRAAAQPWYSFLAPNFPYAGVRVLVVEGWLDDAGLAQVVEAVRLGGYERILTTGGPIERISRFGGMRDYAELTARDLRPLLPTASITAVPAPAATKDRTYTSALALRRWARETGVELGAFNLMSRDAHTRRSHYTYTLAFGPRVKIGAIATQAAEFDGQRWWASSEGVKTVMSETLALMWLTCCFFPPSADS